MSLTSNILIILDRRYLKNRKNFAQIHQNTYKHQVSIRDIERIRKEVK